MARELAISIYLTLYRFFFFVFNQFDTRKKTTFVVSFGGNVTATLHSLERLIDDQQIVIVKAPSCKVDYEGNNRTVLQLDPKHISQFIQSIFHIATSRHIIVDNYFAFLAVSNFKEEVTCTQLWHAAGAIKKFGLEDLTNKDRSTKAMQRFKAVYNRFDQVAVGSDSMVDIFKQSFGLPEDRFVFSGIPRTDFFYNQGEMQEAKRMLETDFPIIMDKKVLLYAPTYRDGELHSTALHMDLDKMYQQFKHEYVLFLRLHPAVSNEFENKYPGFIFNVSNYSDINHLLVGADILITDYSSIPFEFSLLNKPMIFYVYDYEAYVEKRGIWMDDFSQVPGPVVTSTEGLIYTLREKDFQIELVRPFAQIWNKYSKGNSSDTLIHTLYDIEPVREDEKVREHV